MEKQEKYSSADPFYVQLFHFNITTIYYILPDSIHIQFQGPFKSPNLFLTTYLRKIFDLLNSLPYVLILNKSIWLPGKVHILTHGS